MSHPRIIVLALAVQLAVLPVGGAQSGAAQENGLRRTVVVSAVTDQGKLINGLLPENFRATVGGRDIQILSADYDTGPHRIVFVLDVSSSMDDKRGIEELVAGNLLTRINPASPIAVLTFSSTIVNRVPFSTDRAAAQAELESLKTLPPKIKHEPIRKTALLDTLVEALTLLNPPQTGDTICVFTDGGDNASKLRESRANQILSRSGARFFCFLILDTLRLRARTPEEAGGPATLLGLSENSGGGMIELGLSKLDWINVKWSGKHQAEAERLRQTFLAPLNVVAQAINVFYRLEIQLPEPVDKPRRWKLEIVDPQAGKHDPKVILRYPARLFPAGAVTED